MCSFWTESEMPLKWLSKDVKEAIEWMHLEVRGNTYAGEVNIFVICRWALNLYVWGFGGRSHEKSTERA